MRFCAEGKPSLSAILQTLPTAVTLEGLNARHENLAAAFDEVLEREHPIELNVTASRQFSPALRAIFRDVFRQVRTPYCLAAPVRRDGVLRGGAFFMADEAFASQRIAFLRTLCEFGYDRLEALGLLLPELSPLTARQREVLALCAQGKSDWEIAQVLDISPATAHEHIEAAKKKLGVRTRVQAAVLAAQKGWI